MFEEDDQGNLSHNLSHTPAHTSTLQLIPDPVPHLLPPDAADTDPKVKTGKTLREMLYEEEPWMQHGGRPSPQIARLLEKRVNRSLAIVADWMLATVEQHRGDEMTLVVLLEQAELVRQQIIWPLRDAQEALAGLAQEARKLEQA